MTHTTNPRTHSECNRPGNMELFSLLHGNAAASGPGRPPETSDCTPKPKRVGATTSGDNESTLRRRTTKDAARQRREEAQRRAEMIRAHEGEDTAKQIAKHVADQVRAEERAAKQERAAACSSSSDDEWSTSEIQVELI